MGIKKGISVGGSSSITHKEACRMATTTVLPSYNRVGNVITATSNGQLADIDGVTPALDDSILVLVGTGADRGIYKVTTLGDGSNPFVLTRRDDADQSSKIVAGMRVPVGPEGTVNANKVFTLTTPAPITLNTTSLSFTDIVSGLIGLGTPYVPTNLIRIAGIGNVNDPLVDWSPSQFQFENYYSISGDGANPITITGIDSSQSVGPKTFTWLTAATLTVSHQSVSSAAGNRINCPNNVDMSVPQYGSFTIATSTIGTSWRVISTNF